MKNLTLNFLISTFLTSLFLIINAASLRERSHAFWNEQNSILGYSILFILIGGFFLRVMIAKVISYSVNYEGLNRMEKGILCSLFFMSTLTNALILNSSMNSIFGGYDVAPAGFQIFAGFLYTVIFVLPLVEYEIVAKKQEGAASKYAKVIKRVFNYYIAFGLTITWDVMMIGIGPGSKMRFDMPDFWSEMIALIVIVFMIFLPFYRFFLFELFSDSRTLKEHLIVMAAILWLIACAIFPLFFIDL